MNKLLRFLLTTLLIHIGKSATYKEYQREFIGQNVQTYKFHKLGIVRFGPAQLKYEGKAVISNNCTDFLWANMEFDISITETFKLQTADLCFDIANDLQYNSDQVWFVANQLSPFKLEDGKVYTYPDNVTEYIKPFIYPGQFFLDSAPPNTRMQVQPVYMGRH